MNYKTQNGLIKALERASHEPMTVKKAWWYYAAEFALINHWGWTEEGAAKFIAGYKPNVAAYRT